MWCEACRDHFNVDHYGDDDKHKVGVEYGWTGRMLATIEIIEQMREAWLLEPSLALYFAPILFVTALPKGA